MRIVAIHDIVSPIRSDIANAYIDFSQMTASVVAVVTDVTVDGKPVVGYGFNSNGRYAQHGLLNERFIRRVSEARPDSLVDGEGLLDPAKCWAAMMANEKPGGHGERSVAVGVLDMALWDALAKVEEKPLWKLLAERYRGGEADPAVEVYAAGGYYYPGKDLTKLQDEMRSYLDRGYSAVKLKIGGASLDDDRARIEAVLKIVGAGSALAVDANGRFDLETALAYGRMLEGGVKIFEYEPTMIHEKTMVVDGMFSMFGSSNLDARSSEINEELDVTVYDAEFGRQMENIFETDLRRSREYTLAEFQRRSWWEKTTEWLMAPFRSQL